MHMKSLILFFLLSYGMANAAVLECKSFINMEEINSTTVVTSLKDKILVAQDELSISYVTEVKPNIFSLESFIPSLEVRIYSESQLNNTDDTLKATAWARDFIIERVCKKIK